MERENGDQVRHGEFWEQLDVFLQSDLYTSAEHQGYDPDVLRLIGLTE